MLQLCTHILVDGAVLPLDNDLRAEIVAANDEYARNALRVLALARRELPPRAGAYTPESVERGLTFLGLAAMMDPPRPEVAEAVRPCREAGIRMGDDHRRLRLDGRIGRPAHRHAVHARRRASSPAPT